MISVRIAVPDDARAIAEVHVDTWRKAYAGIVDDGHLASISVESRFEKWRERLEKPAEGYVCFVAIVDDRLVGFVDGGPVRGSHAPHRGELYAFYVSPEAQRSGVGRALARAAIDRLRAEGRTPVLVWVLAENEGSVAFYERLGGRRSGETTIRIGPRSHREIGFTYD